MPNIRNQLLTHFSVLSPVIVGSVTKFTVLKSFVQMFKNIEMKIGLN